MADEANINLIKEINQSRHFNFDTFTLANKVLNTLANEWSPIVNDLLFENVEELFGHISVDEEKLEALKSRWFERLSQHEEINAILEEFKETIDSKVLVIPKNYILSDDIENARLKKDEATDEDRMLEAIRNKRAYIIQLRIEIETLKEVQKMRLD